VNTAAAPQVVVLQRNAPRRGRAVQAIARAGRDLCVYYQQFFIGPNTRSLVIPEHTPASRVRKGGSP